MDLSLFLPPELVALPWVQLSQAFLLFLLVGFFGLTLLLSTLTGLLIYARFIKGVKWWRVRRGRGPQVSSSDWHKLIGILSLAFNLVIAVTGAVLGLENLARYAPEVGEKLHPQPRREVLAGALAGRRS